MLTRKGGEIYISRIDAIFIKKDCTSEVEKLVGNLVWASYIEPQGWPCISAISSHIKRLSSGTKIKFTKYDRVALWIWRGILCNNYNSGISFYYILGNMTMSPDG